MPVGRAVSLWMYVPIVVSLIVGLALSLAAFAAIRKDETQELHRAFEGAAIERVKAIDREMQPNLQFLEYLKAFYDGSEKVERDEFERFVSLGMKNLKTFFIVGWAPRVPDSQRQQFEAQRTDPNL